MSVITNRSALKELKCPNCGAPISQFNASAQSVVCGTCNSYVAIGAGDPEIVGKSNKLPASPVPIELGAEITIDEAQYMVLGRVMYRGWDDEDSWQWNEWMLGAPDGRMLWLSYDEKGFSIYTKKRFREQFDPQRDSNLPIGDLQVRIHERYPARIVGAQGELTWRPTNDEKLYMAEGARNGKRYSVQKTDEEMEVYEGRGVSESQIAKSFNDEKWLKRIERREQAQRNRKTVAILCILFAFVALSLALFASSFGETAVENRVVPLTTTGANVPIEFVEAGRPSNVQMKLVDSIPVNTFVDVDVHMIAPDGTDSYLFSQSFWHETGVDEDGRWQERDYNGSGVFVPLSTGQHELQIRLADSTAGGDLSASISVRRNVIMVRWFIIYAVVVGGLGVLFYMSVPSNTQ